MSASDSVAPNLYADVLEPSHAAGRATSRSFSRRALALSEIASEFLIAACGFLISSFAPGLVSHDRQSASVARTTAPVAILVALLIVFMLHCDGRHNQGSGLLRIRDTERRLRCAWQALFLVAVMMSLFGIHLFAATMLLAAVVIPALLIAEKQLLFPRLQQHFAVQRAAIYGAGDSARAIISALHDSLCTGLRPIMVIEDDVSRRDDDILAMDYLHFTPVPVQPGPVTPALLRSSRCEVLVIAGAHLRQGQIECASRAARDAGLATAFVYGFPAEQQRCVGLDDLVLLTPATGDVTGFHAAAKRVIDVLAAAFLLILLAPFLLLIAALIRVDSPGPALFTQKRAGRNGSLFDIYKFRSMYLSSPQYAPSPASSADPRITRIGRLLRRMSLDELPQLINVLLGNMSLVGPRPEMPFIVDQYGPGERRRLQVLPGITGLWQLSADRAHPIHQNLEYDLYYIRHRTLLMDVAILIHTFLFALCRGV